MKEIITMEVIKITTMGSFDPLIQLVTPFAEDVLSDNGSIICYSYGCIL